MFFSWCCKHCGFLQRISCVISILSKKKPARDPKQCGGSKRIVYYNVDEYDDDDDEDGDDDDNDDDDDVH